MSNIFNERIIGYNDDLIDKDTNYFCHPILSKNDFLKVEKYKNCAELMLSGYDKYSKLEQAIIIFQSLYNEKTQYYQDNGRLLGKYRVNFRLNINFTRDDLYQTNFRKKYGFGLVLPEIYLLDDIKNKDANCIESSVLLGNIFRSIGIECYFKINYFSSHVCLVAKVDGHFHKFQFQDIGNTYSEKINFDPEDSSDEKLIMFWNMFCGKIFGLQKNIEKAIIAYDQVEYKFQSSEPLAEELRYLLVNRLTSLIENGKYKQVLQEINDNNMHTSFHSYKDSVFEKLDMYTWDISWAVNEFEPEEKKKYIPELKNIIDICIMEENYFINGYDITEDSIKKVIKLKERALILLNSIQER